MDIIELSEDPVILSGEIMPEVYAMIVAWESSYKERNQVLGSDVLMQDEHRGSSSICDSLLEPYRRCTTWQPPKPFYRTFWRSICRRILQRAKESVRADIIDSFMH